MPFLSVLLAALLTAAVSLQAQPAGDPPALSLEDRLARLERDVEQLRHENAELKQALDARSPAPPVAAAAPPAPPAPPKEPRVQFGGLVQGQAESGDRVDSRFPAEDARVFLRRARLRTSGSYGKLVDFRLEGDFSGSLGNTSSMRAQLTDGYINWNLREATYLRIGQFKTPYGFEQLFNDPRLATPERTLTSDRMTLGRQLGAQLGGDLAGDRFTYAVGLFNGSGSNFSGNDNDSFATVGRVNGVVFREKRAGGEIALRIGANGFVSDDDAVSYGPDFGFDATPATAAVDNVFRGERRGTGVDAQMTVGRWELQGELLRATFEPDDAIPYAKFDAEGWYAQLGWFAIPDRLQFVGKLDAFDPDDRRAGDETDTWSVGANYFLRGHDVKLQLHWLESDNPWDEGSGRLILRMQTAF
jgi:phosphate-selective porin